MYNNYYSSSDVQLYFSNRASTRLVKVDTSVSLGYNLRQTSAPIYSLGSREIQFYSHGNTVGNGVLTVAFTDEEYLKYCLDEVATDPAIEYYQEPNSNASNGSNNYKINPNVNNGLYRSSRLTSNTEFITQLGTYTVTGSKSLISIGAIRTEFDIKLYINNESLIRESDTKVITLKGVKIVGEGFNTSSTTDSPLLLSYQFIFKDIVRG